MPQRQAYAARFFRTNVSIGFSRQKKYLEWSQYHKELPRTSLTGIGVAYFVEAQNLISKALLQGVVDTFKDKQKKMATFISGTTLRTAVEDIIAQANKKLFLVSPYVYLGDDWRHFLKVKSKDPHVEIYLLFRRGKNFFDYISPLDIKFLKEMPNIEIRCLANFGSRFYANENASVIASMDLDDEKSVNHTGVYFKSGLLNNIFADSFDSEAYDYHKRLIARSDLLFKAVPKYHSNFFGQVKGYAGSEIEADKLKFNFKKLIAEWQKQREKSSDD